MVEMIKANVPGYYLFHRAEESGGLGSYWLSKNRRKKLRKFKAAIAFDRCDFDSIITHQSSDRCCSELFAESLADQLALGDKQRRWRGDDTGSFTDTANYTGLIGECTNISVGYQSQHTKLERQFAPFLPYLLGKLIKLDSSKLVYDRKPGAHESLFMPGYTGDWRVMPKKNEWEGHDSDGFDNWLQERNKPVRKSVFCYDELLDAVTNHPHVAAALLEEMGYSADDILSYAYGS